MAPHYTYLPIYKATIDLVVAIEKMVRGFERYHKYAIGAELRMTSKEILFGISRANLSPKDRIKELLFLRNKCEEMKILVQLAKELQAFRSFKQFERASLLCVEVCKQAQAWLYALKSKK